MEITVLYGTETGNAEMLAEDLGADLGRAHSVEVTNLADFDPADFDASRFYLLVCSTYGDGELPASARPFASRMEAGRPDLSGIHFAIFGMGDSEYEETFNFGPKTLAEIMIAAGASQVGERIAHDASGPDMAEDLALPWARDMVALAAPALGQAA